MSLFETVHINEEDLITVYENLLGNIYANEDLRTELKNTLMLLKSKIEHKRDVLLECINIYETLKSKRKENLKLENLEITHYAYMLYSDNFYSIDYEYKYEHLSRVCETIIEAARSGTVILTYEQYKEFLYNSKRDIRAEISKEIKECIDKVDNINIKIISLLRDKTKMEELI